MIANIQDWDEESLNSIIAKVDSLGIDYTNMTVIGSIVFGAPRVRNNKIISDIDVVLWVDGVSGLKAGAAFQHGNQDLTVSCLPLEDRDKPIGSGDYVFLLPQYDFHEKILRNVSADDINAWIDFNLQFRGNWGNERVYENLIVPRT